MFSLPPCVASSSLCRRDPKAHAVEGFSELLPVGVGDDLPALPIQKVFSQAPPGAKSFLQINRNAHYHPTTSQLGRKCVFPAEAPPDRRPFPISPGWGRGRGADCRVRGCGALPVSCSVPSHLGPPQPCHSQLEGHTQIPLLPAQSVVLPLSTAHCVGFAAEF